MELTAQRARAITNEAIELDKILKKVLNKNQEFLKVKLHYAVKNELYYLAHSIQKQIK